MRFLVDAQLPIGLARMLQQHGHESEHVADLKMMQTSDKDILLERLIRINNENPLP